MPVTTLPTCALEVMRMRKKSVRERECVCVCVCIIVDCPILVVPWVLLGREILSFPWQRLAERTTRGTRALLSGRPHRHPATFLGARQSVGTMLCPMRGTGSVDSSQRAGRKTSLWETGASNTFRSRSFWKRQCRTPASKESNDRTKLSSERRQRSGCVGLSHGIGTRSSSAADAHLGS